MRESSPGWAGAAMVLVGNLYPVPEEARGKLPYIYIGYLVAVFGWFLVSAWTSKAVLAARLEATRLSH